ncbi:hypothetical protein Thiowin_00565 [Thiorhodovibrio winogradskyi]|uniref:DUF1249 domain-containing protein n=1 Tax=Thiorhodovibrio winogradskyi TaxID=77007 RepID=A0ABZ0S5X1_9GAMM|nr:DUF1249 domain-containing protein [Thiorhodovibrio winogradskyi]
MAIPWLRGPTVGALLELMEENHRLLLCLAPDLRRLSGAHRAPGRGTDLYLDVIAQARYTTILRLTYRFPPQFESQSESQCGTQSGLQCAHSCDDAGRVIVPAVSPQADAFQADPDARLRVCHDARQVEVIALRQTALPLLGDDRLATLQSKWNANWFLAKWLSYCVSEDYRFFPARQHATRARVADPATLC